MSDIGASQGFEGRDGPDAVLFYDRRDDPRDDPRRRRRRRAGTVASPRHGELGTAARTGRDGVRAALDSPFRIDRIARMKLATLKDGTRDGQLAVVSADLSSAHFADGIAPTLQRAMDDWNFVAPQLDELYRTLNHGRARHAFPFDARRCMAPLPRAFQWLDGSVYANHVELLRRARGAQMPETYLSEPTIYQGGADDFLGPCDDAIFGSEDWGIDFEAEVAVLVDDVPMGANAAQAAARIRLLALANDWSLRHLIPRDLAKGFGFLQGKPATAFAPVAVTPDELGDAWRGAMVHLPVLVHWNGKKVGEADAGTDAVFDFGQLLAHAALTRNLRAGTVLGAGTVSNRDPARGWSCIAEARAREVLEHGEARTEFMKFGDRVRIEMLDPTGASVFGAIDQQVAQRAR
jgi:fumarylacetoacetate (FAA) hydrolase